VFEFINLLTHQLSNNSITSFSRLDEIRTHLVSQWSQLFQRLLHESRTTAKEVQRLRDFSESIEDLKAVVLASVATPSLRETAKGAIQYRHLIEFVSALKFVNHRALLLSNCAWAGLLAEARIVETRLFEDERLNRPELLLILADGTFYRFRFPTRWMSKFEADWASFRSLEIHAREAIVDALLEDRDMSRSVNLRHEDRSVDAYIADRTSAHSAATSAALTDLLTRGLSATVDGSSGAESLTKQRIGQE
jgi:hypothetical protein